MFGDLRITGYTPSIDVLTYRWRRDLDAHV